MGFIKKVRVFLFVITSLAIIVYFQNCAQIKSGKTNLNSTAISGGTDEQILAFAQQPDGKLLVGGFFGMYNGEPLWPGEGIVRLNPDGSKDETFKISTPGVHISMSTGFLVQRNGKIVVAGSVYVDTIGDHPGFIGTQSCTTFRLNADGSLDPSFICGKTFNFSPSGLNNVSLVEQADGKIVVLGQYYIFDPSGTILSNQKGIFRINSNGTLDTTYHSAIIGNSNTDFRGLTGIAQDSSGRIIIGGVNYGATPATPILKRVLANGDVDTTFNPAPAIQNIQSVAIQPDGKIVVGGTNIPTSNNIMARFNADGTPDTVFNNHALAANISHLGEMLQIQSDGKIIITGMINTTDTPPGQPKTITRLNADGTRDTGFDQAAGTGSNSSQIYFPSLAVSPNGNIFLGGSFSLFNGVSVHNIVLLSPQGALLQ